MVLLLNIDDTHKPSKVLKESKMEAIQKKWNYHRNQSVFNPSYPQNEGKVWS